MSHSSSAFVLHTKARNMLFPEKVTVTDQEIDLSHVEEYVRAQYIAEARAVHEDWKKSDTLRRVVGIAGPSGAGKSVFVAVMKNLLSQIDPELSVVPLTIDAYHFRNEILREKGISTHKGRFDTYDVGALAHDLSAFREGASVSFPNYSRTLHEPTSNGPHITVDTPALLIVEGLWLLYPEYGWESIAPFLGQKLFLEADAEVLRERTIGRHIRGGRTHDDAAYFYDTSDSANNSLVIATKQHALRMITIG